MCLPSSLFPLPCVPLLYPPCPSPCPRCAPRVCPTPCPPVEPSLSSSCPATASGGQRQHRGAQLGPPLHPGQGPGAGPRQGLVAAPGGSSCGGGGLRPPRGIEPSGRRTSVASATASPRARRLRGTPRAMAGPGGSAERVAPRPLPQIITGPPQPLPLSPPSPAPGAGGLRSISIPALCSLIGP